MKSDWIQIMKETKKLKLTFFQALTHYWIVVFLFFIVSLTAWSLVEIYVTDTYTGVRTARELINTSLPFLMLAMFFIFVQYRRLKFKEFNVSFTDEQFQEAVERTVSELEWRIDKNGKTFFRAYRPWNWTGSWGEMVTIIKGKDSILINSICDPNRMSSVASYGWNRKNIKTFLKNLSDVLDSKPIEIKVEKKNNEWSAKNILIRLFAYPFCISLIVLGFYMILQPSTGPIYEGRTRIAGFGAIVIASIYLYADIKILTKKNDKKRKHKSDVENASC
jgi:hypothetical protein